MTIFEFNEQLCEIIAGEDGYYNYDKQEILDLARQMKTSAEEYELLQECKDAADAHETFYPTLCDVWIRRSLATSRRTQQKATPYQRHQRRWLSYIWGQGRHSQDCRPSCTTGMGWHVSIQMAIHMLRTFYLLTWFTRSTIVSEVIQNASHTCILVQTPMKMQPSMPLTG